VPGSDKGDTKAEPKIWAEMNKFRQKADKSQGDLVKLNAAAKTGNVDAVKAAVGAVGQSCKACHDSYRKEWGVRPSLSRPRGSRRDGGAIALALRAGTRPMGIR
jgi:hypothetical protein